MEEEVEWEYPLNLLDDKDAFQEWFNGVGDNEEVMKQLVAASLRHVQKYGTRSVLDIGQRIDNLTAQIEEFSI